jgi:hypothetical protein
MYRNEGSTALNPSQTLSGALPADSHLEIKRLREEVANLRSYATNLEQSSAAKEANLQSEINYLRNTPNQEQLRLQRENKDLKQMLQNKEKEMMGRILADKNPNIGVQYTPQQGMETKAGFSSVGRPGLLQQQPGSYAQGGPNNFMNESHHSLDQSVYFPPQRRVN